CRNDTILRKMVAIPLGVARAAIDEAIFILERQGYAGRRRQGASSGPEALGRAEAMYMAARAYAYDSLERQWDALVRGAQLTKRQRAHVWLSRTNAFQMVRDVTRALYDAIGAESIYARRS